jgi:hypothetical protein
MEYIYTRHGFPLLLGSPIALLVIKFSHPFNNYTVLKRWLWQVSYEYIRAMRNSY